MEKNELFESYPIPKAVAQLSIPMMLGMLVMVIYNMADAYFVGLTNDVNQIASVTISMPIFTMLMAVGSVFGVGGGSYISRLFGKKDIQKARNVSSFSFYSCLVVGVIISILGIVFMPFVLKIVGASPATYDFAKEYLSVIIIGAPTIILGFSTGQIIRAEGCAKEAMKGMMLGTILNIILDPIFILVLGLGVKGAGLATVLANIVSILYYIKHYSKKTTVLSIKMKDFCIDLEIIKSILLIGIPVFLNNILMSFANLLLNNYAISYGDAVVASLGINSRIVMLPTMLTVGLCQGAQPLMGYNYSAKNYKRLKGILKFVVSCGLTICIAMTTIIYLNADNASKIFVSDPEVISMSAQFLKVTVFSIPTFALQFLFMNLFQAMGKSIPALIVSISRQGLIFMPLIMLLNKTFGLDGLVYAQPIADVLTTIIGAILFAFCMKSLNDRNENSIEKKI